jgi:hypothetical protein
MASTTTKLSAAAKNGRSASTARPALAKTSKTTQRPSAPAPKGSKAATSVKKALAAVPPAAPVPAVRAVVAAGASAAPAGAKSELKAQLGRLSSATSQISGLKRSINKSFFDVGLLLNQIRNERLYEVKGYGSFESFVEREIDMNKVLCLKTARIAEAIQRDQALAAGFERAVAAVSALDGMVEPAAAAAPGSRPAGSPGGVIPLHKQ